MIKKILLVIFTLVFIYLSVELFKYFSYWGLGFGAILLATILCSILITSLLTWIIKKRKIIITVLHRFFNYLIKTRFYQKIAYRLQSKWPRLYKFIKKRLVLNSPTGLYATIGGLISGIFFLLFIGVGFDLIIKNPLFLADVRIIHLLRTFFSTKYTTFFVLITNLANTNTVLIIATAIAIILLLRQNYRAVQFFIISIGSGFLLHQLIKWSIHRLRPQIINYIPLPNSYSFPSGHAVMSVCLYGSIAYLLFKRSKKIKNKALIIATFLLLCLAIGLSRVYLGVHYPSDVLAGWYLGLAILTGSITVYEIKNKFYPSKTLWLKQTRLVPLAIVAFIVIFFVSVYQGYRDTTIVVPRRQLIDTDVEGFIKNAPKYSEDLLGQTMEPISFIVIGRKQNIAATFIKAGWSQAEPPHLISVLKELSAIAKNVNYSTGPLTPAFYNEQANDLGFEKATLENSARLRHHTRYWQTNYQINSQPIWVATASFDEGVELGPIIKLPTHKINPNIDSEREYIFQNFQTTGQISNYQKINLVGTISGTNASGDKFFTDGQAYVIELK